MATINELKIMKRLDAVEKMLGIAKDKGAAQGISMAGLGNHTVPEVAKAEVTKVAIEGVDIEARLSLVEGQIANLNARVEDLESKSHKHNFGKKKHGKEEAG